jgi:hypothetical protein
MGIILTEISGVANRRARCPQARVRSQTQGVDFLQKRCERAFKSGHATINLLHGARGLTWRSDGWNPVLPE